MDRKKKRVKIKLIRINLKGNQQTFKSTVKKNVSELSQKVDTVFNVRQSRRNYCDRKSGDYKERGKKIVVKYLEANKKEEKIEN